MKYIKSRDILLENMAQSKAILRKVGIQAEDERFQKIIQSTNKDGYTGFITKLVFKDDVDVDEALDLYSSLKEKGINLADVSKKSYDEILDIIYNEDDEVIEVDGTEKVIPNKLKQIGKEDGYRIYFVPTYEDGLKINSPSWCLKTKKWWKDYNVDKKGTSCVLIKEEAFNRGVLTLATPNSYYGDNYTNKRKPNIRFGITVYPNDRYDDFDDDNKEGNIPPELVEKVKELIADNGLIKGGGVYSNDNSTMSDLILLIDDLYDDFDISSGPFNRDSGYMEDDVDDIEKVLNYPFGNGTIREFLTVNISEASTSDLAYKDAFMDKILYTIDSSIPLSGSLLNETETENILIKYKYGFHKTLWGKRYLLQSFNDLNGCNSYIYENLYQIIPLLNEEIYIEPIKLKEPLNDSAKFKTDGNDKAIIKINLTKLFRRIESPGFDYDEFVNGFKSNTEEYLPYIIIDIKSKTKSDFLTIKLDLSDSYVDDVVVGYAHDTPQENILDNLNRLPTFRDKRIEDKRHFIDSLNDINSDTVASSIQGLIEDNLGVMIPGDNAGMYLSNWEENFNNLSVTDRYSKINDYINTEMDEYVHYDSNDDIIKHDDIIINNENGEVYIVDIDDLKITNSNEVLEFEEVNFDDYTIQPE